MRLHIIAITTAIFLITDSLAAPLHPRSTDVAPQTIPDSAQLANKVETTAMGVEQKIQGVRNSAQGQMYGVKSTLGSTVGTLHGKRGLDNFAGASAPSGQDGSSDNGATGGSAGLSVVEDTIKSVTGLGTQLQSGGLKKRAGGSGGGPAGGPAGGPGDDLGDIVGVVVADVLPAEVVAGLAEGAGK